MVISHLFQSPLIIVIHIQESLDTDRALTISKMAEVCKKINFVSINDFTRNFRTPGHIPILIASKGLLRDRMGHTELCIYLMSACRTDTGNSNL